VLRKTRPGPIVEGVSQGSLIRGQPRFSPERPAAVLRANGGTAFGVDLEFIRWRRRAARAGEQRPARAGLVAGRATGSCTPGSWNRNGNRKGALGGGGRPIRLCDGGDSLAGRSGRPRESGSVTATLQGVHLVAPEGCSRASAARAFRGFRVLEGWLDHLRPAPGERPSLGTRESQRSPTARRRNRSRLTLSSRRRHPRYVSSPRGRTGWWFPWESSSATSWISGRLRAAWRMAEEIMGSSTQ